MPFQRAGGTHRDRPVSDFLQYQTSSYPGSGLLQHAKAIPRSGMTEVESHLQNPAKLFRQKKPALSNPLAMRRTSAHGPLENRPLFGSQLMSQLHQQPLVRPGCL